MATSTPTTSTPANGIPTNGAPTNGATARRGAAPLPPPVHPPPVGLTAREWALFATVVYADLFDSPLPLDRAQSASIGVVFDEAEIRRLVRGPALAPLLTLHPAGFLVLCGREHLIDALPEREARSRALLERTRSTLAILSGLPFIRALVTSGGIVHRNAGARPDVDLFVVAARDRVYTAYSLLVLATKLTGMRQLICPNYLVDESELAIAYHRDLFTAHQLVSARPLSGQRAYEMLCHANETWIRPFFPAFAAQPPSEETPLTSDRSTSEANHSSAWQRAGELAMWPLEPAVERLLRAAWRLRLRRRAATAPRADVVASDGILKLHLSDYRRRTLERFASRLGAHREKINAASRPPDTSLEPVGT